MFNKQMSAILAAMSGSDNYKVCARVTISEEALYHCAHEGYDAFGAFSIALSKACEMALRLDFSPQQQPYTNEHFCQMLVSLLYRVLVISDAREDLKIKQQPEKSKQFVRDVFVPEFEIFLITVLEHLPADENKNIMIYSPKTFLTVIESQQFRAEYMNRRTLANQAETKYLEKYTEK